jgi:hypothetical protein
LTAAAARGRFLGKKLVIIGFVLSLVLAVYIFATHETRSLKESINKASAREPRAVLEDFVAYRYEGDTLKARLNAHLAEFFEPNVVVLEGEVSGERRTEGGEREEIGAESASAYFKPSSLTKMLDPTQANELERAELTGFVEVKIRDQLLTTDYAEYINEDKIVRSSHPVRVEGPGRVFVGDSGFVYNLATQILNMAGKVKGEVSVDKSEN